MSEFKKEIHPSSEPLLSQRESILIAGAGIAGCCTALELANIKTPEGSPKYEIILCDQKSEILRGSSDITPGRMGLGFHYLHKPTALMYLKATIEFQRKFGKEKDFRVGAELPKNSPLRRTLQRGRYFVTKDSHSTKEEILETYKALKVEYTRLVKEDPQNKVFGEPEDFFRILDPEEYKNDVNMEKVDIGIETPECLLNWTEFRKFLISKLEDCENIQIQTNTKVNKVRPNIKELRYAIETVKTSGASEKTKTHYVSGWVNCTWENARALNATAELKNNALRTNRLKALLIVELPESLKNMPSAFFCMGPHGMFSNLGNGFGAMTYAPKTSMINSTDLDVPEEINRYLQGRVSLQERMDIAIKIKRGVTKYIPKMKDAKIQDVRFGIVQTNGKVDIFDHKSEFSRRDYNGISVELLNSVTNACMKLLYGPENGVMVANTIEEHIKELAAARKYLASLDVSPPELKQKIVQTPDLNLLRYAVHKPALKNEIVGFFNTKKLKPIPLKKISSDSKASSRNSEVASVAHIRSKL